MHKKILLASLITATLAGCNDVHDGSPSIESNNKAPSVNHIPNLTVGVDQDFTFPVEAEDEQALSYALDGNPDWINIDAKSGILSVDANQSIIGDYSFYVVVSDGLLETRQLITLSVTDEVPDSGNQAPVITKIPPLTARTYYPFSYQVKASDPDGDFLSFSLVDHPAWVSIDPETGFLSVDAQGGHEGDYSFSVKVHDGKTEAETRINLTVEAADKPDVGPSNSIPVVQDIPVLQAKTDNQSSYQITANDADGDILTFTLKEHADWVKIDPERGLITAQPTIKEVGEHTFHVVVTDGHIDVVKSFEIHVTSATPPLFSELKDSDKDQIPDILDEFPLVSSEFIDANYNGVGDNQDGHDLNLQGSIQDLKILSERLISFQTGLGSLTIESTSPVFDKAQALEQRMNKAIAQAQTRYNDGVTYNIQLDASGHVTGGAELKKETFGTAVSDLYYLALASHRGSAQEALKAEQQAMNLIKWLRWNKVQHDQLNLVDAWYLSGFGQAVLLLKDKLNAYQLEEYLLSLMWQSNVGKTAINELIHFDYDNIDYRDQTYFSADLYRSEIFFHFAGVAILPENTPNQVRFKLAKMAQFQRYLLKALQASPGLHPFLKPDGSAYHHYTNYMSGYVPQGAYSLVRIIFMLDNSPWALKPNELSYLTKYVTDYYFYTSLNSVPVGGRGRLTSLSMPADVSNMLYLSAALVPQDSRLQQTAVNYLEHGYKNSYHPTYRLNQHGFPGELKALEHLFAKMASGATEQTLTGSYYYPYSSLFATRQAHWQATIKGLDRWTWSYEGGISASNPQNLYGLYESYGSLQLHYFDKNKPTSGLALNPVDLNNGYQWAHISGTTAPMRSLDQMLADDVKSRYRLQNTSTGGAVYTRENGASHGVYMLELGGFFAASRDIHFQAYKSYFQLGEKIIALGSGIRNQTTDILGEQRDYPIHTTLFHTKSQQDPLSSAIYVDENNAISATSYSANFANGEPLLLVDNENTGYFIPDNQGVHIQRGQFSSRGPASKNDETANSGHRNLAWIDHGRSPSAAKYEYVVLPEHDFSAVQRFASEHQAGETYQVAAQDDSQHIVYDIQQNIWAYALFSSDSYQPKGPLLSVEIVEAKANEKGEKLTADDALVALIEPGKESLNIALAYPDLRLFDGSINGYSPAAYNTFSAPVVMSVCVAGQWKLEKPILGVEVSSCGEGTKINVELVDGLTRQLMLRE